MRSWIVLSGAALLVLVMAAAARADVAVYNDALASGWQDWSWGGVTRDFSHASPVYGGTASIAVTYTGSWSGLQLGDSSAVDVSAYDTLRFYVHGGSSGGQTVQVQVGDGNSGASVLRDVTPAANVWTQVDVPLLDLGSPRQVTYVYWFNATAGSQPVFYLDAISFLNAGIPTPTPLPPGAGPPLNVDASAGRHAISPYIYGMNFADEGLAAELRLPVRRWGGNSTTRYNWQNDTSNHASDWYFENIPNDNNNPGALPDGSSSDQFIEQDRRTGSSTLLTVPLIGWTPKTRAVACGFSIAKYGAQQSADPWNSDCGNGVRANGSNVTGNSGLDTSLAIAPSFVQDWIDHLTFKYGDAAGGGVRFYDLDNEPMLWNSTHRDVHPAPTSYDEMRDQTYAYAAAVKVGDPTALTLGPAEWGWTGYFWSALDAAPGGSWWNNPQDRLAHGNVEFVAWYLQQMRSYEQQNGLRILDYLDLHYYPQASGVSLSGAGNAATQALRLRTTRSLWDSTYGDESWIGDAVQLLPRMHQWVTNNYPGTKLAISEYNWGALDNINGALAQADVLGIFGREALDLATLWGPPTSAQPGAFAFRMYRNYDGGLSGFGDVAVSSASGDQSQLVVYGAQRGSSGALTLMILNKSTQPLTSSLSLAGFNPAANASVYRYSSANLTAIVHEADQAVSPGGFTATFPPTSMTLLVLMPSGIAPPTSTATASPTPTIPASATASRTPSSTPTRTPTTSATRTPSTTPTRSATSTPSPTRTFTPPPSATASTTAALATSTANASTPTPSASTFSVGGQTRYFGSGAAVGQVSIQASGPSSQPTASDVNGQYAFAGLASGDWHFQPTKVGDLNGAVSALDASVVLQAAVGLRVLTSAQRLACDVNASGSITAIDATLILQYRVGLIAQLPVVQKCGSDWGFDPAPASLPNQQVTALLPSAATCQPGSIDFHPLSQSASAQDFNALLFGDCSGNWQPAGGGGGSANTGAAKLRRLRATKGRVRYALAIASPTAALDLVLRFDPQRLRLLAVRRAFQLGGASLQSNLRAPGTLAIALASPTALTPGDALIVDFAGDRRAGAPLLTSR